VLMSCAPVTPTPAPTLKPTPVEKEVKPRPVEKEVAAAPEKPKYGGVYIIAQSSDIGSFDECYKPPYLNPTVRLTNEELLDGDWTKGPAGTGEATWLSSSINRMALKAGCLAESWESPDLQTLIFHIRKGVRYALNPKSEASRLVNGRELNADDVVFSLSRASTVPTGYYAAAYPYMAKTTTITAPDKWTVVIKCKPEYYGDAISVYPDYQAIVPREVVEKYGDLRDWRNSCGTGPFILTDFVSGSSAAFVRNPNYWAKDPVGAGKGNQLPYLDGVKFLIIPDFSTRLAALRTAKIDHVSGVSLDDATSLRRTNPELKYVRYQSDPAYHIGMRTDKKGSPFSDVRVRRALYLAMDKNAILKEYYGGEAELLNWPIVRRKEYEKAYCPLEQLPAEVRELYQDYNPDKAKQLLAEAGYPNGFKAKVICWNTATQVDLFSLLKSMWAKVGVDLTIDAKEYGVWSSIVVSRAYDDMLYSYPAGSGTYYRMNAYWGPSQMNISYVNDPKIDEARAKMERLFFDEDKMEQFHRELMPYVLGQAYAISPPWPYLYVFWQPWVKNFYGVISVGYLNGQSYVKWIWLDQDLKEKMTGKR